PAAAKAPEPPPAPKPIAKPAPQPAPQPFAKAAPAPAPARETELPSAPRKLEEKPLASPAVRQRAQELGIRLQFVDGSGPGGRVTHAARDACLSPAPAH